MPYSLSKAVSADLRAIARYTVRTFGARQAKSYGKGIEDYLLAIGDSPGMGRAYDHIRPGLRCFGHKSHSIYYVLRDRGILIVRVLHSRQDASRHL